MYDLHTHTTRSDSTLSLAELIGEARVAGLHGLAVCDHDTLIGVPDLISAKQEWSSGEAGASLHETSPGSAELVIIPGLEVSSIAPDQETRVHVLVYGSHLISPESALAKLMNKTIEARNEIAFYNVTRMERDGLDITWDRVKQIAGNSACVYKQHIAEALSGKTYGHPDYQRVYRAYVSSGCPYACQVAYPDACEVVEAAAKTQAVVVLAHPGQSRNFHFAPALVEAGLQGIELNHPDHNEDDRVLVQQLASQYGLLMTGGSDYHGANSPTRSIGCCVASHEGFEEIIHRVG